MLLKGQEIHKCLHLKWGDLFFPKPHKDIRGCWNEYGHLIIVFEKIMLCAVSEKKKS